MPARRRVYTLPTPPLMPQPIIQPDRKPRYHLPHARPNRLRADLTPWPQRERDADQRERDADQRERDAYQRGDHDGLCAGAAPAVVGSGAGQLLPLVGNEKTKWNLPPSWLASFFPSPLLLDYQISVLILISSVARPANRSFFLIAREKRRSFTTATAPSRTSAELATLQTTVSTLL